jgi:urease accessory protein
MIDFSGHLFLQAEPRADGRTVLASQSFRAPFHLSKPYWDRDARSLLVQVVNPTAGILAGDRLEAEVRVATGAAVTLTTPSASRVFRMQQGEATSSQRFSVADAGWLEVIPEPLVPHRGSRFRQVTAIEVAAGGSLFYVDQLMPGRLGHDEAWVWDTLCLETTVRLGGELILRERLDMSGAGMQQLAEFGRSGATACFANALVIVPRADSRPEPEWLQGLRDLHGPRLKLGVSALRQGGWSLKCVAADPVGLRDGLRQIRQALAQTYQRLSVDLRKL